MRDTALSLGERPAAVVWLPVSPSRPLSANPSGKTFNKVLQLPIKKRQGRLGAMVQTSGLGEGLSPSATTICN